MKSLQRTEQSKKSKKKGNLHIKKMKNTVKIMKRKKGKDWKRKKSDRNGE